jgi:uncharacterized membrane protein
MTDKEQHISHIIDKLDSQMLEANALTHELRELRRQEKETTQGHKLKTRQQDKTPTHAHDYKIGNKVIIKNGY